MTRCLLGSSKRTTMRVPARIGSSVAMKSPPVLMFAMFFLTRDGPLLLFVNSYSTCAEIGARSNRLLSNWAELFILLLHRLRHAGGRQRTPSLSIFARGGLASGDSSTCTRPGGPWA